MPARKRFLVVTPILAFLASTAETLIRAFNAAAAPLATPAMDKTAPILMRYVVF